MKTTKGAQNSGASSPKSKQRVYWVNRILAGQSRESIHFDTLAKYGSSSCRLRGGKIGKSALSNAQLLPSPLPTPSLSQHHLHHTILTWSIFNYRHVHFIIGTSFMLMLQLSVLPQSKGCYPYKPYKNSNNYHIFYQPRPLSNKKSKQNTSSIQRSNF